MGPADVEVGVRGVVCRVAVAGKAVVIDRPQGTVERRRALAADPLARGSPPERPGKPHHRRPVWVRIVLRNKVDGVADRVLAVRGVGTPRPPTAAARDDHHVVAGDQGRDVRDDPRVDKRAVVRLAVTGRDRSGMRPS